MAMTPAELQKRIAELEAENAKLKAAPARGITIKRSEKGGMSVYGIGQFPATYYASQWRTLLAEENVQAMREFLNNPANGLTEKPGK